MIGASFCAKCRTAHPPGEHVGVPALPFLAGSAAPSEPEKLVTPGDGVMWSQRAQEGHVEFLDGRKATATFNPGCACCQERRRQNAKHQRDFKEKRKREKKQ